jgi:hypothetical protein
MAGGLLPAPPAMTPRSGTRGAVNEVGAPSGTQIAVDVLKNAGTARQELRDFVRGLYTGDDGVTSPGLVFAADPLQVTTDLTQYKQDLRSWYSDAAFWIDMRRSARFWAQETHADARTWGVDAHAAERLPERLLPARRPPGRSRRRPHRGCTRVLRGRLHADRERPVMIVPPEADPPASFRRVLVPIEGLLSQALSDSFEPHRVSVAVT